MGEIRCVDDLILTVMAVACRDRLGEPYEMTLELARDQVPFGAVGERCGFRLSRLSALVRAAREDPEQITAWADPDDRFPEPEREYFSLRARDRTDLPGNGELRCSLRASAEWLDRDGGSPGQGWRLTRRAVIEAWGDSGIGVRAVLTSAELVTFLDTVLRDPGGIVMAGLAPATASATASTAGNQLGAGRRPARRQRGRVPDGTARSRLPALRAPA
jgi:hypothetical protein